MLVYRICKDAEINQILRNQSLLGIGKYFTINKKRNTHLYQEDKKYIHFFAEYDDLFFLDTTKGNCICTYDIPEDILNHKEGLGFYLDRFLLIHLEQIREYAIEEETIDFTNLKKVEKITDYIDYEEYLDKIDSNKLITIYDIVKNEKVLKKNRSEGEKK